MSGKGLSDQLGVLHFNALCLSLIHCFGFHLPLEHLEKVQRPEGRWSRGNVANFFQCVLARNARAQMHIFGILAFKGAGTL